MNEIRQNKATKQWVIYSTARGARPHDFTRCPAERDAVPDHDPKCPFCAGNEAMLGPVIAETASGGGAWLTRIVANKYPSLETEAAKTRQSRGIYLAMEGYGRCEVIIESPHHNRDIGVMSLPEVRAVVDTYHERYVTLMRVHENMLVLIFRNHGERAGTSLMHPHSQLIVTGIVPSLVREREECAQRHFDQWGRCVYCEIVEFERSDRTRVVFENASFLAFVPFAAEVPFEVWIVPKRHEADFGTVTDAERADLAEAMRDVLGRLRVKLGDPDYNYVINTSSQYESGEPHVHWYLQIRPRLVTAAGFELGTGISINPSLPEEDAAFLNRADSGPESPAPPGGRLGGL